MKRKYLLGYLAALMYVFSSITTQANTVYCTPLDYDYAATQALMINCKEVVCLPEKHSYKQGCNRKDTMLEFECWDRNQEHQNPFRTQYSCNQIKTWRIKNTQLRNCHDAVKPNKCG